MIKKNILILLMGLFVLVSCEEEIYENTNISMSVEQYAPIQKNGVMRLSGKVTLPQEFNRETAKVGFYIREFTKDMNNRLEWLFDDYMAIRAYQALMNGEQMGGFYVNEQILWVDGMNSEGTFQTYFHPDMKQYVCFAFAINALHWENSEFQVLSSKPFFFTGEGTAQLKLVDELAHRFELTFPDESGLEVGLCWSATNAQPNVEDACIGYYRNGNSTNNVTFDCLDFGDHDVVYVRGYVQKRIENSNFSGGESYKMIYSNVIEFRPKECLITINSKSDLQNLINSMYVSKYDDYRVWNVFRGKINFNYAVQKEDWIDERRTAEYGRTMYLEIPVIHCSIIGSKGGVIPYVSSVSKSGIIKGLTVEGCDENYGILEDLQNSVVSINYGEVKGGYQCEFSRNRGTITGASHVVIDVNYGKLLDSRNIHIDSNFGLVQGCKDAYSVIESEDGGYSTEWCNMINQNEKDGRIIGCIIENHDYAGELPVNCYICYINYGYIENCGSNKFCCNYNYGVIKNPNGHGNGDNAGGGIGESE